TSARSLRSLVLLLQFSAAGILHCSTSTSFPIRFLERTSVLIGRASRTSAMIFCCHSFELSEQLFCRSFHLSFVCSHCVRCPRLSSPRYWRASHSGVSISQWPSWLSCSLETLAAHCRTLLSPASFGVCRDTYSS